MKVFREAHGMVPSGGISPSTGKPPRKRLVIDIIPARPNLDSAGPAAVKKQRHRIGDPWVEFGPAERRAQPECTPLWPGNDHQDEFFGSEAAIDRPHFAGGNPPVELARDALDAGRRSELVQDAGKLRN